MVKKDFSLIFFNSLQNVYMYLDSIFCNLAVLMVQGRVGHGDVMDLFTLKSLEVNNIVICFMTHQRRNFKFLRVYQIINLQSNSVITN